MPDTEAGHLRELLRVSRLLRQYGGGGHAADQTALFLAAADALELRARRLAHLNEAPLTKVDLHC